MRIIVCSCIGCILAIFITFTIATIVAWMENVSSKLESLDNRLPMSPDKDRS